MAPINADWRTYYAKELSVVLSRSYGPGRYDPTFEQKGVEYPIGYVPWNQRRNLRAFLDLVRGGAVQPAKLAPRVYPFADAPQAYRDLHGNGDALAIVFEHPHAAPAQRRIANPSVASRRGASEVRPVSVGLIGAGNFATGTLIPALKRCPGVRLRAVCSAQGLRAAGAAERHGFEYGASDPAGLFDD